MIYDYVVIGSGFGGSVASLRLVRKGYKVCLVESGKRFAPADFPKTAWNLRKFLWAPRLSCYGIQRLFLLDDVLVLAGSGLGGGSLVYANTLLEPPASFYKDPTWAGLEEDWEAALAPHYKEAKRMLGVVRNPTMSEPDRLLREYGRQIGREPHHHTTDVAVFYGEPGVTVKDPYFGGQGPDRAGCTQTGHCMVGCRDGGKNTLDKNYLYLAERDGLEIVPEHQVTAVEEQPGGGYVVTAEKVTDLFFKRKKRIETKGVVFAAGVLGTLELLMRCKQNRLLPRLSDRLGASVRTNSETLTGVTTKRAIDAKGVAITSGLYVNDHTHIEVVRYPAGSDLMLMLAAGTMVDGGTRVPRGLKYLWACLRHPIGLIMTLWPFGKARRSIILLIMQSIDNYLTLLLRRRWFWPFGKMLSSVNRGRAIPTYIPEANAASRSIAKMIGGVPQNTFLESLLNIPITAHILGGCVMGKDRGDGVIDSRHRVFGYDNMYVVDGSAVPGNLGVNPSLTIMAMSERAMSHIPDKT